jgi:hypothetical protein
MNSFSNLRLPSPTFLSLAVLGFLSFDAAFAQNIIAPSGTAARAQLIKSSSVHNGQELSAKLMDSIYLGDRLVLPAGTLLRGNIGSHHSTRATLLGTVTQAKQARWFGRSGKLRFAFKQVRLQEGEAQAIQGTPVSVGAEKTQELTMDAEGGVKGGT